MTRLPIAKMLTRCISLEDAAKGYQAFASGVAQKFVIDPNEVWQRRSEGEKTKVAKKHRAVVYCYHRRALWGRAGLPQAGVQAVFVAEDKPAEGGSPQDCRAHLAG